MNNKTLLLLSAFVLITVLLPIKSSFGYQTIIIPFYDNGTGDYILQTEQNNEIVRILRTKCNPAFTVQIKGKSESDSKDSSADIKFYLSNGETWQQYNILNDKLILRRTNVYRYHHYKNSARPNATIYQSSENSLFCKMKIEGENEEYYVRKI